MGGSGQLVRNVRERRDHREMPRNAPLAILQDNTHQCLH